MHHNSASTNHGISEGSREGIWESWTYTCIKVKMCVWWIPRYRWGWRRDAHLLRMTGRASRGRDCVVASGNDRYKTQLQRIMPLLLVQSPFHWHSLLDLQRSEMRKGKHLKQEEQESIWFQSLLHTQKTAFLIYGQRKHFFELKKFLLILKKFLWSKEIDLFTLTVWIPGVIWETMVEKHQAARSRSLDFVLILFVIDKDKRYRAVWRFLTIFFQMTPGTQTVNVNKSISIDQKTFFCINKTFFISKKFFHWPYIKEMFLWFKESVFSVHCEKNAIEFIAFLWKAYVSLIQMNLLSNLQHIYWFL